MTANQWIVFGQRLERLLGDGVDVKIGIAYDAVQRLCSTVVSLVTERDTIHHDPVREHLGYGETPLQALDAAIKEMEDADARVG